MIESTPTLMATGHRELRYPRSVRAGFAQALRAGGYQWAAVGGAEGADEAAGWGAVDAGVPFTLVLPNRFYRQRYPRSVSDDLYRHAEKVVYVVDRHVEPGEDPMDAWRRHHWAADNFARNVTMAGISTAAAVCSSTHPCDLARRAAGGTAHCVRTLIGKGYRTLLWVHDAPEPLVEEVAVAESAPTLFDEHAGR